MANRQDFAWNPTLYHTPASDEHDQVFRESRGEHDAFRPLPARQPRAVRVRNPNQLRVSGRAGGAFRESLMVSAHAHTFTFPAVVNTLRRKRWTATRMRFTLHPRT